MGPNRVRRYWRVLALVLVTGVLTGVSTAAKTTWAGFSDVTTNLSNSFASGQLALTDDDSGTAAFSTGAPRNNGSLAAGQALNQCIKVSYNGSWSGSSFTDNFTFVDSSTWTASAGAAVGGGVVTITPTTGYPKYRTSGTYNLRDSSVIVEVPQVLNLGNGSTHTVLQLTSSAGNTLELDKNGSSLSATETVGGTPTSSSATWNASAMRWWRIASQGDVITWSYSADGFTWTALRSKSTSVPLSAVTLGLTAGYTGTEPSPGTAQFERLSFAPNVGVRMYGTTSGALVPYLNLKIERGTGGSFGSCTGFVGVTLYNGSLSAFSAAATDYASGIAGWAPPTTTASQVYRITITVSTDPAAGGKSASGSFVWEAQSDPYLPDWTNSYPLTVLNDSPFAYWKLDETSGTTAADSVGSRNGTHTNITVGENSLFDHSSRSITSQGISSSRMQVPIDAALRLNASFSIEFWYRPNAPLGSFPSVLGTGLGNASNTGWSIYLNTSLNRLYFKRDGADLPVIPTVPTTESHIVITYDEPTKTLYGYLNGTRVGTPSLGTAYVDDTQNNSFQFGAVLTGTPTNASIDDIAVYDVVLTANQIASHYAART